jgi:Mrp family chromosome partitioning ATPase
VNDRPARYIVVVGSGKGGVGKSTVSLHLALAFARRGPIAAQSEALDAVAAQMFDGLQRRTAA